VNQSRERNGSMKNEIQLREAAQLVYFPGLRQFEQSDDSLAAV